MTAVNEVFLEAVKLVLQAPESTSIWVVVCSRIDRFAVGHIPISFPPICAISFERGLLDDRIANCCPGWARPAMSRSVPGHSGNLTND